MGQETHAVGTAIRSLRTLILVTGLGKLLHAFCKDVSMTQAESQCACVPVTIEEIDKMSKLKRDGARVRAY